MISLCSHKRYRPVINIFPNSDDEWKPELVAADLRQKIVSKIQFSDFQTKISRVIKYMSLMHNVYGGTQLVRSIRLYGNVVNWPYQRGQWGLINNLILSQNDHRDIPELCKAPGGWGSEWCRILAAFSSYKTKIPAAFNIQYINYSQCVKNNPQAVKEL